MRVGWRRNVYAECVLDEGVDVFVYEFRSCCETEEDVNVVRCENVRRV